MFRGTVPGDVISTFFFNSGISLANTFEIPQSCTTWWHQDNGMLSVWLSLSTTSPLVRSGFPSQRANNVAFNVFFIACMNKLLSKQLICWWLEMLWCACSITLSQVSDFSHEYLPLCFARHASWMGNSPLALESHRLPWWLINICRLSRAPLAAAQWAGLEKTYIAYLWCLNNSSPINW